VTDILTPVQVAHLLATVQRKSRDGSTVTDAQVVIASYTLTSYGYNRATCTHCNTVDYVPYAEDATDFADAHAGCADIARLALKRFNSGDRVMWESAYVVYFGVVKYSVAGRGDSTVYSVHADNDDRDHTVTRADLTSCVVDELR
jgi:hypothetical protein